VVDRPRKGRPSSSKRTLSVNELCGPIRKPKRLAGEMNVPERVVYYYTSGLLRLGAYRRCASRLLATKLKEIRTKRCRTPLVKRFDEEMDESAGEQIVSTEV